MFARHDLVWLSQPGWQYARAMASAHCHDAIDIWRRADWPAVVRRAEAGLLPGHVAIGLALPPCPVDGSRTRIGVLVSVSDVRRTRPPLPIAQAIESVPPAWQAALAKLDSDAIDAGLSLHVYGSVALQALTRQPYLSATSDIDLLLRPATRAQLHHGLALLGAHARTLPLDGEIVFPNGQAVAWKELAAALHAANGTRVLVKEMHHVSLARTDALLAMMEDHPCRQ